MREFKFRAWDGKVMRYENHEQFVIRFDGVVGSFNGDTYDTVDWPTMQTTGLKDKNGVEIYEGDIVTTHTDKVMVISWSKRFASFVIDREGWAFQHWFGEACNSEDCEVIGNIYKNPELLKP